MNLEKLTKEELETLSFPDLTEIILKDNKKPMNTPNIFRKICDIIGLSDETYASKIGDYYTTLTTDKRFILLDKGMWDLRDNHIVKIEVDEEEDEEEDTVEDEEEIEDEQEEIEEDSIDDEIIDDEDDDLDDLSIVDEDEMEEE
jgi:DNA-directed RNA polymerase subunit delta